MSAPIFRQKLEAALATLDREGHREVAQVLRQLVEAHTVETWNQALQESSGWIRQVAGRAPTFEQLPREHEAVLSVVRDLEWRMPLTRSAPEATHAALLERMLARSPVSAAEARTLGGWLRQLAAVMATATLRTRLEAAASSMEAAAGCA